MSTVLCWIRRDLRLHDHRALYEACQSGSKVIVVFVFDTTILSALPDRDDKRVSFIHAALTRLDAELREHGSQLVVLHGDPIQEIPRFAAQVGASTVYAAHDYEPEAITRDREVGAKVALRTFKDQVVFERDEVLSGAGAPFRVFTPYSKAWLALASDEHLRKYDPNLSELATQGDWPTLQPLETYGLESADPGVLDAQTQLAEFLGRIDEYGEQRDFNDREGVSRMSVHLRFGTISVRECFRAAWGNPSQGARKWISELIWREFYQMILSQFPHVVHSAFQAQYASLSWPGTHEHYLAWEEGRTGYPIVDAAMRCLNATGWMHNRARMIVAMFLTKDLLCDYRWGEAHFARKLLDFDLAQNNGGWQWSASTGVDAQPYFRVFNPYLQSRKFDPEGRFIRQWCPELAGFDDNHIHAPHEATMFEQAEAECQIGADYPAPIVDHSVQRDLAIALFKQLDNRV